MSYPMSSTPLSLYDLMILKKRIAIYEQDLQSLRDSYASDRKIATCQNHVDEARAKFDTAALDASAFPLHKLTDNTYELRDITNEIVTFYRDHNRPRS